VKQNIVVIIRPPADARRLEPLQRAVEQLRAEGHSVRARLTWERLDARRWARAAAMRGIDVVVAAGGDGTINQVVNGLAAADAGTRLGVVPLGTANDFARGLQLPFDVREALFSAVYGAPAPLDVARVNRRCFVNVSIGGFVAEATRRARPRAKRMLGGMAYALQGARLLAGYRPIPALFRADGNVIHDGGFAFFAVANARMTGGGTPVAPAARPQDGLLDVTLVTDFSRSGLLRLLPHIRAGTHLEQDGVISLRAREFTVEAVDDVPVNADGELVAGDSFRYEVFSRHLTLMVPPGASLSTDAGGVRGAAAPARMRSVASTTASGENHEATR
jgi:YegS/Rv2252/BmrU family lipid kinase